MSKLSTMLYKIMLYIVFFAIAVNCKSIYMFFMDMNNMTIIMILMAVMMIVDLGWGLYNGFKQN